MTLLQGTLQLRNETRLNEVLLDLPVKSAPIKTAMKASEANTQNNKQLKHLKYLKQDI